MAAPAPGASFPMDSVTAEREIYQLVTASDLSELTSAKVRKHLQEQFGMDFTPYKNRVNEMTRDAIAKMQKNKAEPATTTSHSSDDEDEDANGNDSQKKDSSSDSDSDPGILSTDRKPKKQKKVQAQVTKPVPVAVNNFNDMVSNVKSSRRAAASKAMKDIRKSAGPGAGRGKKKTDKDEDMSGKFGTLTKLCYISSELQEIVGSQYMKRCDVVKALWDYIRTNQLFDPKDKRLVICDEKLEVIIKRKKFKAFGMTKFLTNHIINPREMGPEYEQEANDEMARLTAEWKERKRIREEEEAANAESDEVPEKKAKVEKEEDDNEANNSDEDSD